GAHGVGLFRTELQFMVASSFPRMREQKALYEKVIEASAGRPVTFRTLDIGGDKVLPYLRAIQEENPAMGWRAIRFGLDRPAILRLQLRALLHAAAGRDLKLMFPMVADVSEVIAAKDLVDRELRHLIRHGYRTPERLQIGVMIEVPSLLFQLDELFRFVDFVSVGSNDLFQFFCAVDRGNTRVADRFDPLCLGFMRALRLIVDKASTSGIPVTLCGEIAGRPLEAMALLALGYRDLSMSASALGPIKAMVLALDTASLTKAILPLLEAGSEVESLRPVLRSFAAEHDIPL